jgi:hypothetical protein
VWPKLQNACRCKALSSNPSLTFKNKTKQNTVLYSVAPRPQGSPHPLPAAQGQKCHHWLVGHSPELCATNGPVKPHLVTQPEGSTQALASESFK